MRKFLLAVLVALGTLSAPAYAQQPSSAFILSTCGTLPAGVTYAAGQYGILTMDVTGKLCDSATGGGGGGGTSSNFGAAFPGAGTAAGAEYLSSPPTLTTGQMVALQTDVNGNLKVAGTFWPYTLGQQLAGSSVPVVLTAAQITTLTPPTTVTANLGTLNGAATAANQPTNAAQASTTSGQTGPLVQCAVTTGAPTYVTAQTNPLSCDTAGNVRVSASLAWANTNKVILWDGTTNITVKAASTGAAQTDTALVERNPDLGTISDSAWVSGNGTLIGVAKTIATNTGGPVPPQSPAVPIGGIGICDGANGATNPCTTAATVKAASTSAVATDKSLVVQINPQQTPAVSGAVNVTQTDCSLALTTGGAAQNIITAAATIHGFRIMNIDASAGSGEPVWMSFTGTAVAAAIASYPLAAPTATTFAGAGSYSAEFGSGINTNVSVIAATSGHKISCTKW